MAANIITADGVTDFQTVDGESIHLSIHGSFGGGSIALEQRINGNIHPVLDEGVPMAFSSRFDGDVGVKRGDVIRLNMTGSVTPAIDFNMAGAGLIRTI